MTTINEQISALKQYAKEHGLEVRFRDHKTDQGDFCIFIYDKANFRESYAVGFDGYYGSKAIGFDKCLKSAYHWIDKRDKRFTYRDGRWQYGHFHFIVWKNKEARDLDHYLTIEDANKAAKEYVNQGCCVVCYDQPPMGKSRLAKVYGNYEGHVNEYVMKQIKNGY